jgi:thymidylate synthase ThyX
VFTFEVEDISRVTLAQLTRHRLASYEVESQRYTDNGKRPVAVPPSIAANGELDAKFLRLVQMSREFYEEATAAGVPREDARFAALEGTCTRLVMTMNARELRHFFALRCCNRAQWEIRRMADMMLDDWKVAMVRMTAEVERLNIVTRQAMSEMQSAFAANVANNLSLATQSASAYRAPTQVNATLELDRVQFGRMVYQIGDEESQRVGVKLAGGFA